LTQSNHHTSVTPRYTGKGDFFPFSFVTIYECDGYDHIYQSSEIGDASNN